MEESGLLRDDVLTEDKKENRLISGVSVELSAEGQRAQRGDPQYAESHHVHTAFDRASAKSASGAEDEHPYCVHGYTGAYSSGFGTYLNPRDEYLRQLESVKHLNLSVAGIVLSSLSVLAYWLYGFAIVPALVGMVFGMVSWTGGGYDVKILGKIGFFIGVGGVIINAWLLLLSIEHMAHGMTG
ncbi:MAG: prepilin peptidase [Eubacterium sp.]|nr:prepilin peptidase [Eubacterium sp.]